jgi:hypothetical protein
MNAGTTAFINTILDAIYQSARTGEPVKIGGETGAKSFSMASRAIS